MPPFLPSTRGGRIVRRPHIDVRNFRRTDFFNRRRFTDEEDDFTDDDSHRNDARSSPEQTHDDFEEEIQRLRDELERKTNEAQQAKADAQAARRQAAEATAATAPTIVRPVTMKKKVEDQRLQHAAENFGKLKLAPGLEQHVNNIKTTATMARSVTDVLATMADVLNNVVPGAKEILENQILGLSAGADRCLSQVQASNLLKAKFKTHLTQPTFFPRPSGYHFDPEWLSYGYIKKNLPVFNPDANNKTPFDIVWDKVVGFGQRHFFTEKDYKECLMHVTQGDAYRHVSYLTSVDAPLAQIVNELASLHDSIEDIDDIRRKIDKFTRKANESIINCMSRARREIHKLAPLYDLSLIHI